MSEENTNNQQSFNQHVDDNIAMQRSSEAARRMIIQGSNKEVTAQERFQQAVGGNMDRIAGAALAATIVVGGGAALANEVLNNNIELSPEKTTHVIESGEGWNDAADDIINIEKENINDVVSELKKLPENSELVLPDYILKPGDTITIPVRIN